MKVILSRKGFDSRYGGQPSPILPDGTMLSFPIPGKHDSLKFSDLYYEGKSYLQIIKELNPRSKFKDYYNCHLDPDLRKDVIKRKMTWIPAFGQKEKDQKHLLNQGIESNDLFLFFGSFQKTKIIDGRLMYDKDAPEIHAIFGYLQIDKMYSGDIIFPDELSYHPHAQGEFLKKKNNCIYKAKSSLSFMESLKGAGCLKFHDDLILTKKGMTKKYWILPDFFRDLKISRHTKDSFKKDYFESVSIGQEIVIEENDEVTNWAKHLIIKGSSA